MVGEIEMHCRACEAQMNNFEATRKYSDGSFVELCNHCFSYIADDVETIPRVDLMSESDNVTAYVDYEDPSYYLE